MVCANHQHFISDFYSYSLHEKKNLVSMESTVLKHIIYSMYTLVYQTVCIMFHAALFALKGDNCCNCCTQLLCAAVTAIISLQCETSFGSCNSTNIFILLSKIVSFKMEGISLYFVKAEHTVPLQK